MARQVGNWLNSHAQKLMSSGTNSSWRPVSSYRLQEPLPRPAGFDFLISDPRDKKRERPQHLCRWHRIGRCCQHIKWLCSHSRGPQQVREKSLLKFNRGKQCPAPEGSQSTETLALAPSTMANELLDSCYFFLKDLGKQLSKE